MKNLIKNLTANCYTIGNWRNDYSIREMIPFFLKISKDRVTSNLFNPTISVKIVRNKNRKASYLILKMQVCKNQNYRHNLQ